MTEAKITMLILSQNEKDELLQRFKNEEMERFYFRFNDTEDDQERARGVIKEHELANKDLQPGHSWSIVRTRYRNSRTSSYTERLLQWCVYQFDH